MKEVGEKVLDGAAKLKDFIASADDRHVVSLASKSYAKVSSVGAKVTEWTKRIVDFGNSLASVMDLATNYYKIQGDLARVYEQIGGIAKVDPNGQINYDQHRRSLEYAAKNTRLFFGNLAVYYEANQSLPTTKEDYDAILQRSDTETVNGLDTFLQKVGMLKAGVGGVLRSFDNKPSAILPIDLLYNELRAMTSILVTYDPSPAGASDFETLPVETPPIEGAGEVTSAYWYSVGRDPNWAAPAMVTGDFGAASRISWTPIGGSRCSGKTSASTAKCSPRRPS